MYTNLSDSGPNDSGFTCANLMNGFLSKLPTSILIFDSTKPTLQEREHWLCHNIYIYSHSGITSTVTCEIIYMQLFTLEVEGVSNT